jgi:uroporphyrinogen-III decarboxylase
MSLKQFETFYWPTLRKVVLGLIEAGIMVTLFAEGRYASRLEVVNDFPKGWVLWHFDQTDMRKAKKILGATCCIMGNVPSSLIATAEPEAVKQYCRELIDTCAPGGGYILAGGCSTTEAKEANLRAMMQAAEAYGRY